MSVYIRADHGIPFTPDFGPRSSLTFGVPAVASKTTLIYAVHTIGTLKGAYGSIYGHVMKPSISFLYEDGTEIRLPDDMVRDLANDRTAHKVYAQVLDLALVWPHRDRPMNGRLEVFNIRRNPEGMGLLFSVRDETGRWVHLEESLDDERTLYTGRASEVAALFPRHVRAIRKELRGFLAGKWEITPDRKAVLALAHALARPVDGSLPKGEPDPAMWSATAILHEIVHRFGIDRNDAASMAEAIANIIKFGNSAEGRAAARAALAAS